MHRTKNINLLRKNFLLKTQLTPLLWGTIIEQKFPLRNFPDNRFTSFDTDFLKKFQLLNKNIFKHTMCTCMVLTKVFGT